MQLTFRDTRRGRILGFLPLTFLLYISVFLFATLTGCKLPSSSKKSSEISSSGLPLKRDERLRQANEFFKSGNDSAGLAQLQIACKEQPDAACVVLLAEALNRSGEPELAEAELSNFVSSHNDAPPSLLEDLLRVRTRLGDFRGAAQVAKKRIATKPLSQSQMIDCARALIFNGEIEQGVAILKPLPDTNSVLTVRGLGELALNRPARARELFQKALTDKGDDSFTWFLLGIACRDANDLSAATTAFEKAISLPDPSGEAFLEAARIRAESGFPVDAMALLHKAPREYQSTPLYWKVTSEIEKARKSSIAQSISRGYEEFHGGAPREAERIWSEVLTKTSGEDAREVCAALHNSAFKRQDGVSALRWADEGLIRFPNDPYFRKRRAEALLGQNRPAEAEQEALKIKSSLPATPSGEGSVTPAEVADLLCRVGVDGGKNELLQQGVQMYKEVDPEAPFPFLFQAEWQSQKGREPANLEKTLDFYRKAAEKNPEDPDTQAQIGLLLADLNRPEEAEATLLHALTLWPRVMEGAPHARLVRLYQSQGKTAESEYHAREYQRFRQWKDGWPTLLKALRQDRPLSEWLALGDAALLRRENWIALCAFRRSVEIAPNDPDGWRGLAAVYKRLGWFFPAFDAARTAHQRDKIIPK